MKENRQLCLLVADDSEVSVNIYIHLMEKKDPIILLNSRNSQVQLRQCIMQYQPKRIYVTAGQKAEWELVNIGYRMESEYSQYQIWIRTSNPAWLERISSELAVMLSTSGSTGSSKMVMLSYENLQANAESIIRSLKIEKGDRAAVMLPISYSYGLSVVNSYLLAGGELLFPKGNIVQVEYWDSLEQMGVQAICGVPYTYQVLQRLKILSRPLKELKLMTQAGGGLSLELQKYFQEEALRRQIHFAVMYGQTEATARMSCFFLEEHADKLGSVGRAIPGGVFCIQRKNNQSENESSLHAKSCEGEILYRGRNVSLGYAYSWKDIIAKENMQAEYVDCNGWLHTGDVGWLDEDGYLYLTGRKKRIIKMRGYRVNLDELQEQIGNRVQRSVVCVAVPENSRLMKAAENTMRAQESNLSEVLYVVLEQQEDISTEVRKEVERALTDCLVSRDKYKICCVDSIPRGENGKVQYAELQKNINYWRRNYG